MGLFGFLHKQTPQQAQIAKLEKQFEFVITKGFRGYKKLYLTVYGNEESEKNNEHFTGCELSHKTAVFEYYRNESSGFILVYIDGLKIGALFDESQIMNFLNNKIEAIHAHMKEETIATSRGAIVRHRVELFAKIIP